MVKMRKYFFTHTVEPARLAVLARYTGGKIFQNKNIFFLPILLNLDILVVKYFKIRKYSFYLGT